MNIRKVMKPTAVALAIATAVSGCASIQQSASNSSQMEACGIGAVVGGLALGGLAVIAGKDPTKYVIGGAAAGCGAGLAYRARVKHLEELARTEKIKMQVRQIDAIAVPDNGQGATRKIPVGMSASFESGNMFDSGSEKLNTEGQRKVRLMAKIIADKQSKEKQQGQTPKKILVVGHTDATGTADANERISEGRAKSVAAILSEEGVNPADIFYQGAGASKPVADNSVDNGREANRRVEITEVQSTEVLARIIDEDRNNPRYLAHGTRTKVEIKSTSKSNAKAAAVASQAPLKAPVVKMPDTNAPQPSEVRHKETTNTEVASLPADKSIKISGSGKIDFGGEIVRSTSSTLAQGLKPVSTSFALIASASASQPVSSCIGDMPRTSGKVKNLDSGEVISDYSTNDYLPGLNGRGWFSPVNGHVVSVGPVAILRNNAKVAQHPAMQFIPNYKKGGHESPEYKSIANTYEGADSVLFRVFSTDAKSPATCMDIVFDKRSGLATEGEIFYPKNNDAFVAKFVPARH